MASNYQEKKQARINRYRELAEKNHAAASAKREESREMMSAIPMGQPILIGHHREKRDRNFREKAWNKLGQAVALSEKAEYYEHKAQVAENNHAISSDDPEAIKLLKEKLEKLEKLQSIMKAANKIVRSKKLTDEEKIQEMVKLGLSEEGAANALKPDFCGRVGFASYSLQNNNANIKRVKDRIKELEKRANDETTEEEIKVIKACLVAVTKTVKLSPFVNSYDIQEYYVDKDLFEYDLLAPNMIKTLKNLAENY